MKYHIVILLFFHLTNQAQAQRSPAELLLDESIQYHDPNGQWLKFADSLIIDQEVPGKPTRTTRMYLDIRKSKFSHSQLRHDTLFTQTVKNEDCSYRMNHLPITATVAENLNLTCARSLMLRNYYTYLYGLPMKLKDPGTIILPDVERGKFNKQDVDVLKVNYDPSVGKDTWYFYFATDTHALIGYRFYHDETKNDGEYIILEDEIVKHGIKIPAKRTWYVNNDNRLLGTDLLH